MGRKSAETPDRKARRVAKSPASPVPDRSSDPYLPGFGNPGYRVSRYDLDIEYKVHSNRLTGRASITAVASEPLKKLALDLSGDLSASKVSVNGRRAARFTQRGGKLEITLPDAVPAGAALAVTVRYAGNPKPIRSPWGEVGWEELTEGVLVGSQPNGASSWFPCDDHPASKAAYRIGITTDSPYAVVSNGVLVGKRAAAAHTTWIYEVTAPMAPYLATVQIGAYETIRVTDKPVPIRAAVPPGLRTDFETSFARQERIMRAFTRWFGPYPFPQYTVVITEDPLEIPLEAQSVSIFGANHCDGTLDSERLIAHELAHQWFGNSLTLSRWRDIWLHEGFACYSEWLWAEECGASTTQALAAHYHHKLATSPQNLLLGDPGAKLLFDDRVYKRGALTLHALRVELGDPAFFALLHEWTAEHWHSSVTTEDFLSLAGKHAARPLRDLWVAWLERPALPPLPVLSAA